MPYRVSSALISDFEVKDINVSSLCTVSRGRRRSGERGRGVREKGQGSCMGESGGAVCNNCHRFSGLD